MCSQVTRNAPYASWSWVINYGALYEDEREHYIEMYMLEENSDDASPEDIETDDLHEHIYKDLRKVEDFFQNLWAFQTPNSHYPTKYEIPDNSDDSDDSD